MGLFSSLGSKTNFTAPTSAPTLDWNTFQQTFAPVLYSGDPRGALDSRGQWADSLGWDIGGKGNVSIEGLDRDQFFLQGVDTNNGSGDSAGYNPAIDAAYNDEAKLKAWQAAVDKAMADPNTVYRVTGDRLVEQDGTAATGKRSARQVQYKLQNGQLVPVGQNDYERSSGWKDFREQGLPVLGGVLAAGMGLQALGVGGSGGAAAGSYIPSNAAGALGGVGSPTTTAGYQLGQMAGGLQTGGTGLLASPGAGLTLAAPTGTGAGLSAAAGQGLTLAGATGTGAGLAAGTGAGIIGSGIGASIPTGSVLGSLAGAAPNMLATNPALIESAVGTPGYGASSAGAGGGAGAVGSGLLGTLKNAGSGLIDWAKANPGQALQLGGLLGGAMAAKPPGEEAYTGPMPTIKRGGFQASVTPQYRQAQGGGLLPMSVGEQNSGLWRFL